MRSLCVKRLFILAAVLSVGLAYPAYLVAHDGDKHEENESQISFPEVVAKVNGVDIPNTHVRRSLNNLLRHYKARGQSLSIDQEKSEARKLIQNEIDRELLLQKSKDLGIRVSPEQLEEGLQRVQSAFGSEKRFQDMLARQHATLDQYKNELKTDIVIEQFILKEIEPQVKLGPNEPKEFYEKNKDRFRTSDTVKASVILIKIEPEGNAEASKAAREKIESIRAQINDGADFAELAKKLSQDSVASRGGDLGYFTKERMFAPFSDRAFKMKPGELSEVFQTRYGYQILKMTGKKPGGLNPFEKVEDRIKNILKSRQIQKITRAYAKGLRKDADVKNYF
ncbi:MAG: peptidylprolyl isomerase [Nitrospinales bacterium]